LKPTYFFWNMSRKGKPQQFERFICSGQFIYQFVPAEKLIKVYPGPKPGKNGGFAEDSSIAFLFGMKAAEAKARYDLKLFKEDKNYIYVDVIPKLEVDKADFQKARIVLDKTNFLPRQLWFEHPNAGEVIWDIPTAESNKAIDQRAFAAPATPKDWKLVRGGPPAARNRAAQPRVYRPKN